MEKPLCYCFDVSEQDVRDHFLRDGRDYDDLVARTRIGTKCTACLLDLDLVLEDIHRRPGNLLRLAAGGERAARENRGFKMPADHADSGFFVCENGVSTVIRLANYGVLFEEDSPNVSYNYSLFLISQDGRLCTRHRGHIAVSEDLEIELASLANCPGRGWFLLSMYPTGDGLFGTLRPQVALMGPNWNATYHTQPHMMATTGNYRFSVVMRGDDNSLSGAVSIVNTVRKVTNAVFSLSDTEGAFEIRKSVEVPARGSSLLALDDLFPSAPAGRPLFVSVGSEHPTRKHIVNWHADGSWSIDHFPN